MLALKCYPKRFLSKQVLYVVKHFTVGVSQCKDVIVGASTLDMPEVVNGVQLHLLVLNNNKKKKTGLVATPCL